MSSMLLAANTYFDPASWVLQSSLPEVPKRALSLAGYFLEITATSYALGVTLGFSRTFAFVGTLWLAVLLFSPFNYVLGLHGHLGSMPIYGHTLALSNLVLIAFSRIGATHQEGASLARRLTVNWLLASAILLLVLLAVLAYPFFNAAMLIGTFLLAGVLLVASRARRRSGASPPAPLSRRAAPRSISRRSSRARGSRRRGSPPPRRARSSSG
jgi:hypothetical protein